MSRQYRSRNSCALTHSRSHLSLEVLEGRLMLYAVSGLSWSDTNISASFLPDGTESQGYLSNLYAELDPVADTAVWQKEFARALQTWSNASNLNFHFVDDDGSATGASGLAQGDSRFGDIRLGAHSLSGGYLAYAYYPGGSTIAGDITISPDFTYHIGTSIDLYSTLLHELGHSLGLRHSTSGTIMYNTIVGVYQGLTSDDIAGIQAIYGARQDDSYDAASRNDDLASASALNIDASGNVNISADLTSLADVDAYAIVAPDNTDGTLSVLIDTSGLSFLEGSLAVYDSSGVLLASSSGGSSFGNIPTVSLSNILAGETLYVIADGATDDEFGMGAYQLDVNFGVPGGSDPGSDPVGDPEPIAVNPDRLEVNDTFLTSTNLGRINNAAETGLTIHDPSDTDFFSFNVKKSGTFKLSILFTQSAGNLDLFVYDAQQNLIGSSTSSTDNETITSLSLVSGQTYYAQVVSADGLATTYDFEIAKTGGSGSQGNKYGGGKGNGKGGHSMTLDQGHGTTAFGTDLAEDHTLPSLSPVGHPGSAIVADLVYRSWTPESIVGAIDNTWMGAPRPAGLQQETIDSAFQDGSEVIDRFSLHWVPDSLASQGSERSDSHETDATRRAAWEMEDSMADVTFVPTMMTSTLEHLWSKTA